MQSIIVDTSAIVFAAENGVDIFATIEQRLPGCTMVVSTGIIEELERISGSALASKKAARLALEMMDAHKIKVLKGGNEVDAWIVKESSARKWSVCTNDIGLKKELKKRKVEVLSASSNGILR